MLFSQSYACPEHGISIDELAPRMFSFNNPFGACETCTGLGTFMKVDPALVIPNRSLSIREGAIKASGWYYADGSVSEMYYKGLGKKYGFTLDTKIKDMPPEGVHALLYGTGGEKLEMTRETDRGTGTYSTEFEGIINNLERRFRETNSEWMKEEIQGVMTGVECPDCHGDRLKPTSLAVTVGGVNISKFTQMSVREELDFINGLQLTEREHMIADGILKEIRERLGFLQNVGLDYLTLARIATLERLRDLGNTVIVVEHDEETMREADWIVDIGPGAGIHGGELVAEGTVEDICKAPRSITGQYLSGRKKIKVPEHRREGNGHFIEIKGATQNNLRDVDVKIPLGVMTCITGISGSGKSSLINEILYKRLAADLNGARIKPGAHKDMLGLEYVDKVIGIDQSPIGRTPRSNPATYTGVFTDIRTVFSQTQEAKMRGYGPGRFSFNVKGGRCEACEGDGIIQIAMHFLPDIYVPCEVCKGKRYNRETLEVKYKGKSIADVLDMTAEEALAFFAPVPRIAEKLRTLCDVGLGYVKLGQSSTTLSGGEAQRVKLATELSRRATGRTFYILDEPTTGLHSDDVKKLLEVLQRLVDAGNTVLVIEHNLDVIKSADWLIDLGPEGGAGGGTLVCAGTPETVAACEASYTGQYLKKYLL